MKVIILILAFVAILAKNEASFVAPEDEYTVSYPEGYDPSRQQSDVFADTFDVANFGDNLWMEDREGDTLVRRELWINRVYDVNYQEKHKWEVELPNKKINRIRFLNIGRERGYVETVTAATNGGPYANASIIVYRGQQVRLLIEVYTK